MCVCKTRLNFNGVVEEPRGPEPRGAAVRPPAPRTLPRDTTALRFLYHTSRMPVSRRRLYLDSSLSDEALETRYVAQEPAAETLRRLSDRAPQPLKPSRVHVQNQ